MLIDIIGVVACYMLQYVGYTMLVSFNKNMSDSSILKNYYLCALS